MSVVKYNMNNNYEYKLFIVARQPSVAMDLRKRGIFSIKQIFFYPTPKTHKR